METQKVVYISNKETHCTPVAVFEGFVIKYPFTDIEPPAELKDPKFNWEKGVWEDVDQEEISIKVNVLEKSLIEANEKISQLTKENAELKDRLASAEEALMEISDGMLESGAE